LLSAIYVILSIIDFAMGFRENLKAELAYKDMLVKELATLSGIKKRTIDNYLCEDSSMPPVDTAVRIAGALGISVENLLTGRDSGHKNIFTALAPDLRLILKVLEELNERDRKTVFNLAKSLKEMEITEKTKRPTTPAH
jgi:transcriptional regulator with XRE-family HTH domain